MRIVPEGTERLYVDGRSATDTDYCETYGHDLTGGTVTEQQHRAMAPAGRAVLKGADYAPVVERHGEQAGVDEPERLHHAGLAGAAGG